MLLPAPKSPLCEYPPMYPLRLMLNPLHSQDWDCSSALAVIVV